MLKPRELVVDSSLRTEEHHLNTSMKTSQWCHPVYKGVTHVCSEISERPLFSALSRTILGKFPPIMCKNKDNFFFQKYPFFPAQGYFSKNSPYFLKIREEHENLRPLWHKNVPYFFIPWTLSSKRPLFLDFTSKNPISGFQGHLMSAGRVGNSSVASPICQEGWLRYYFQLCLQT